MQKGMGIIGILLTIAIIGFLFLYFTSNTTQQMTQETGFKLINKTIGKTSETITKANLEMLRTAIAKYYSEQQMYPDSLDNSGDPPFLPTYLSKIPSAILGMKVPSNIRHSNKITYGHEITNTGGWLYDPYRGKIKVNYDGLDSEGINYSHY